MEKGEEPLEFFSHVDKVVGCWSDCFSRSNKVGRGWEPKNGENIDERLRNGTTDPFAPKRRQEKIDWKYHSAATLEPPYPKTERRTSPRVERDGGQQ